jgi:ABC-type bacteriocin/lantibiotic exporter with double-glycine peptidase domain
VRVRRALSLGIDRATINRALYFELAKPGAMTVLPKSPFFDPALRDAWAERHAATLEAGATRGRMQDRLQNLAQTLTVLGTVAVTALGALAVLDQRLTLGALVAANLLTARMSTALLQLVGQWRVIAAGRDARRRLQAFLAEPEERIDAAVPMARPEGLLELRGVSFRYGSNARPILEHVDLALGPRGLHVVTGANGSGKSTLLALLQGLLEPTDGLVLLDGRDLRQLAVAERARWLGYVEAAPHAVGQTVAAAVTLGMGDVSSEQVRVAAARAGLDTVVDALPQGYDTPLGAGAVRLSSGQLQRLALARALLRAPAVLLLDEPSAHLDRAGEQRLVQTLKALATDVTVVVASHGRSLLEAADSLLVIKDCRIEATKALPPVTTIRVAQ